MELNKLQVLPSLGVPAFESSACCSILPHCSEPTNPVIKEEPSCGEAQDDVITIEESERENRPQTSTGSNLDEACACSSSTDKNMTSAPSVRLPLDTAFSNEIKQVLPTLSGADFSMVLHQLQLLGVASTQDVKYLSEKDLEMLKPVWRRKLLTFFKDSVSWLVVQFELDENLAVVPFSWFNSGRCWWPPPSTKITSLIENNIPPGSNGSFHKARIIGEAYASYGIAKRKCALAEANADINSDTETASRKRKRAFNSCDCQKRRHSLNVYSSDEEPSQPLLVQVCETPVIHRSQAQVESLSNSNQTSSSGSSNMDVIDRCVEPSVVHVRGVSLPQRTAIENCPGSNSPRQNTSDAGAQSQASNDLEFQKKILRDLVFMKTTLAKHSQYLDYMMQQIGKEQSLVVMPEFENHQVYGVVQEIMSRLPLTTEVGLAELEETLIQSESIRTALILELSRIGGSSYTEVTKRILKKVLTDNLGSKFSWVGFKKKKVFSTLQLQDVIFRAVRMNKVTLQVTDKEIEECIKNWLRHAKFRGRATSGIENERAREQMNLVIEESPGRDVAQEQEINSFLLQYS